MRHRKITFKMMLINLGTFLISANTYIFGMRKEKEKVCSAALKMVGRLAEGAASGGSGCGGVGFAADAPGELYVLGHEGDSLAVDGEEDAVLEETHEIRLRRLLQSSQRRGLDPQLATSVFVHDLSDAAREGSLGDEEIGGALQGADLAKGNDAGRMLGLGDLHDVAAISDAMWFLVGALGLEDPLLRRLGWDGLPSRLFRPRHMVPSSSLLSPLLSLLLSPILYDLCAGLFGVCLYLCLVIAKRNLPYVHHSFAGSPFWRAFNCRH